MDAGGQAEACVTDEEEQAVRKDRIEFQRERERDLRASAQTVRQDTEDSAG